MGEVSDRGVRETKLADRASVRKASGGSSAKPADAPTGPATRGSGRGGRCLAAGAAIALWLAVWQVASAALAQPLLLPGPVEVLCSLAGLLSSPLFWQKVCFSAVRVLGGMLLGYAVALLLAGLSHASVAARAIVRVPLVVMKATPVVCVVVLLLLWLGSANVGIAAVFLMALPAVYFPALEALDAPDDGAGEMLRLHGVRGARLFLAHAWPRLLTFLVAASETVVGMSWKAGIAAELIGVPAGSIGERIYQAKLLLETGELLAWTIVVIVLAAVCERVFVALLRVSGLASVRLAVRLRPRGGERPADGQRGSMCLRDVVLAHGAARGERLDVALQSGCRLCVMGPSGAGKTTLLRTIAGLEGPVSGEVVGMGDASMVFQDARLLDGLSAIQNVELCAAPWRDEASLLAMLSQVLEGVDLRVPVAELSGGQRRRVELVRALAAGGDVVLLDEPFAGLDSRSRELACALIGQELRGRSLVMATHDEDDAGRLGASVLRLG